MSTDKDAGESRLALSWLHAAKTAALDAATSTRKQFEFTAEYVRLLAQVITGPDATCEILPGLAERLMRLHGELHRWAAQAGSAALVADSERETIETLLLSKTPKPEGNGEAL